MLNKIKIDNCLGQEEFNIDIENTHAIVNQHKDIVIDVMTNMYKHNKNIEVVDKTKEASIKLYFSLNDAQMDYISSYLVLENNLLVVVKLINNDKIFYFVNGKMTSFHVVKQILNFLIDYNKIVKAIYNNSSLTVLDNYICNNDETYSALKYNYLRLESLVKQYKNELKIINDNKNDDSINELLAIKNDIEAFDLEKGEIKYITKLYEELNKNSQNKDKFDNIVNTFNTNLVNLSEVLPLLEELESDEKYQKEAVSLIDAFYDLKEKTDAFQNKVNSKNDDEEQYIIDRYNAIKEFQVKYGNTYQEINDYYQMVVAKINYYRYSKINAKTIEDKIDAINIQLDRLKQAINTTRKDYAIKIINYFNELMTHFDENIILNVNFNDDLDINDNNSIIFNFLLNEKEVNYKELHEYEYFNLVNLLMDSLFLMGNDKTVIINDDFSNDFNREQNIILVKVLNSFNNCLLLTDSELYK